MILCLRLGELVKEEQAEELGWLSGRMEWVIESPNL